MQIEKPFEAFEHRSTHGQKGVGKADGQCAPIRVEPDFEMAGDISVLAGYLNGPKIFSVLDHLDMGNNAPGKKAQEPVPIERRAIVQMEREFRERLRGF